MSRRTEHDACDDEVLRPDSLGVSVHPEPGSVLGVPILSLSGKSIPTERMVQGLCRLDWPGELSLRDIMLRYQTPS